MMEELFFDGYEFPAGSGRVQGNFLLFVLSIRRGNQYFRYIFAPLKKFSCRFIFSSPHFKFLLPYATIVTKRRKAMGRTESFNEYAMIRSALEETARKIQAREESIERQKERLLSEEDTVKRGKMMERIDRERRAAERERKSLKALEEKAEKTARKGNLTDEDMEKAGKKAQKEKNLENSKEAKSALESERKEAREKRGKEKDRKAAGSKLEGKETETAEKKAKENKSSERKAEKEGNQDSRKEGKSEKAGIEGRINDAEKSRPSKEKGELEEKIRDAKRTSSEKHSPAKFAKKSPRDLSLEIADARERLHIAEDHFKNSLNTQTRNAFARTRKEE